jgi:hypothetical protein
VKIDRIVVENVDAESKRCQLSMVTRGKLLVFQPRIRDPLPLRHVRGAKSVLARGA